MSNEAGADPNVHHHQHGAPGQPPLQEVYYHPPYGGVPGGGAPFPGNLSSMPPQYASTSTSGFNVPMLNVYQAQPSQPQQQPPPPHHLGVQAHHPPPERGLPNQPGPATPTSSQTPGSSKLSALDKLVGEPSAEIPAHVMPERRAFFERLIAINAQHGEQLTAPPQVSKSTIDLHRLYISVRRRGGFEQVTKDKAWKNLCTEASPGLAESSAAGYQLRRHYQKHLLPLECQETGANAETLIAFADKLKKKKKEKDPATASQQPDQSPVGSNTPSRPEPASAPIPQHPHGYPQGEGQAQPPPQQPQPHGYPAGYPGYPPQHPGWPPAAGPYPPQHAVPPGCYPMGMPFPPGAGFPRPGQADPSAEEQQRQHHQYLQHQQQQQQQAVAAQHAHAAQQAQYHQQQQQAAAASQASPHPGVSAHMMQPVPSVSIDACASMTPGAITPVPSSSASLQAGGHGSRAPSAGPALPPSDGRTSHMSNASGGGAPHDDHPATRPPSHQPPPSVSQSQQRFTPTPNASVSNANAPTPPLTTYASSQPPSSFYAPNMYQRMPPGAQMPGKPPSGYPPGPYPMHGAENYPFPPQHPMYAAHPPPNGWPGSMAHRYAQQSPSGGPSMPPVSVSMPQRPPTIPPQQMTPGEYQRRQQQMYYGQPPPAQAPGMPPSDGRTSHMSNASGGGPPHEEHAATRPPSHQPPPSVSQSQQPPQRLTPTPNSSVSNANAPTPPLTTSTSSLPPTSLYGQNMHQRMPPGPQMPGKSPSGYPPGAYPMHGAENYPFPPQHPMYAAQPPPSGWPGSMPYRYPQQSQPGVPSMPPSSVNLPQRPPTIPPQQMTPGEYQRRQQQAYYGQPPPAQASGMPPPSAPSPGSLQQRLKHQPPTTMPGSSSQVPPFASSSATSTFPGGRPSQFAPQPTAQAAHPGASAGPSTSHVAPSGFAAQSFASASHSSFPPGSLEATASSQNANKRRPKVHARDISWITPRRIQMALRSGLKLETIWAINALNVLLYDNEQPPMLLSASPDLLGTIVEHFRSVMAILFPEEFKTPEFYRGSSSLKSNTPNGNQWDILRSEKESKTVVRHLVNKPSASRVAHSDYTRVTRTGRSVRVEEKRMPLPLKRWKSADAPVDAGRDLGTGLADRMYVNWTTSLKQKRALKRPKFNAGDENSSSMAAEVDKLLENCERLTVSNASEEETAKTAKDTVRSTDTDIDFEDCSTLLRAPCLCDRDESLQELVNMGLALSNILRGFSFMPGNEKVMSQHHTLLKIVGKLLMLEVKEDRVTHKSTKSMFQGLKDGAIKQEQESSDELFATPTPKPTCPPEEDNLQKVLLEMANRLRDDAFVILAHLSVLFDFIEYPEDVVFPILDGLLYWGVSNSVQARDPLLPGVLPPRSYVLEFFCKMSVIENNVDLLMATGPWPRLEQFVRVLCKLTSLAEEIPNREFAIVILNAICASSEAACYVAALETPLVGNLISFLELADSNMLQIVQQHRDMQQGMQALRNDPEKMGTSVGMLRRATNLMLHLARRDGSRHVFAKYQHRLLNFTVSHFMDTRVAVMVADILFEITKIPGSQLETASRDNGTSLAPADSHLLKSLLDDSSTPSSSSPAAYTSAVDAKAERTEDNRDAASSTVVANGQRKRKLAEMNGVDSPVNKDETTLPNGGVSDSMPPASDAVPMPAATKSASDVVKERIRNNILNHQHHEEAKAAAKDEHFEPPPKRPKQNGLANGTSPPAQDMVVQENHSSVTTASLASSNTTANPSGSMTAVA